VSRQADTGSDEARYAEGVKFSAYDGITTVVLGLVSAVLLARVFGAEVLGAFAVASLLTGAFGTVSNVREGMGLVRELTRYEPRTPQARALLWATLGFSAALTVAMLAPFAVLAVYLIRDVFDRPELVEPFLLLVGLYVTVQNTGAVLSAPLVAYRAGRPLWISRTAMSLALIGGAIACWALGTTTVYGLIAATAAGALAALAVELRALRRLTGLAVGPRDLRWGVGQMPRIISFGLRAAPSNYTETAINYADTAVLAAYVPLAPLGAYNRAYGLFQRETSFVMSLSRLYFPTLCSLHAKHDLAGMRRVYRLTARYLILLMVPVGAWLAAAAPAVMGAFGSDFQQAATALAILGAVAAVNTYGKLSGAVSAAAGRPGRISIATTVGAAVNVGLCFLLIPNGGLTGAALANLVGFGATTLLSMRFGARELETSIAGMLEPRYLGRLALACVPMTLAIAPLRDLDAALPIAVVLALPLFFLGLVLARPLRRSDGALLMRAARSAGLGSARVLAAIERTHELASHEPRRLAPAPAASLGSP
jgi:O-antigen/teichoic acid export membrane protein